MNTKAVRHILVGATAVATLAGGVGSALAAPAAQHTSLSISTPATGSSKTAQTITGTLTAGTTGLSGQVVRLVSRVAGSTSFKTIRYAKTVSGGTVTFSVTPPKGKDQYALVYNGSHKTSPAYTGSHSRTVTITVAR